MPVGGLDLKVYSSISRIIASIFSELLRSIAEAESGLNPAAINRNSNGTYDFGVMQINSSWEKILV